MKTEQENKTSEEIVIEILKKHNIKMEIGGCGCCGSPWVSFEYNGEILVDSQNEFRINMFTEDL